MALACAVLSAAGCASVGVTRMRQAAAKPEGCPLEVFGAEGKVKRPFEVVCMLDSKTGSTLLDDRSAAAAIEKAKPEACRCGGDAIIVWARRERAAPTWAGGARARRPCASSASRRVRLRVAEGIPRGWWLTGAYRLRGSGEPAYTGGQAPLIHDTSGHPQGDGFLPSTA